MSNKEIKYVFRILFIFFLISLLPVFYIARYNHMAYDDYAFGLFTHRAWLKTHSLFAVLKAAAEYTKWVYMHWQGTYSSVFLMCLQPGIYTEKAYFLTTFLMLCMLILSVFCLIYSINKYILCKNPYAAGILTIVTLFFCIQKVKTPVDSFYWYNGSLHYTFFQSVVLFLTSLEIRLAYEKKKVHKFLVMTAAVVLSGFCGGSNYLSALSIVLYTVVIFAIYLLVKRRVSVEFAFLLFIQVLCLLVNVLAPGNKNRIGIYGGMSFFQTIYASFTKTFSDIGSWIDLTLILGALFLVPIFIYIARESSFSFPYPGIVAIAFLCLLSAMRAPTYYAMGNEGPDRASNIVQIMFYIFFFFICGYAVGWAEKHAFQDRHGFNSHIKYLICVIGVSIFLIICDDYNNYTSLSAAASLYYNEAQLYHVKCRERENLLQDSDTNGQVIKLEYLVIHPKVLFHCDITSDSGDSANTAMADYYDKAAVIGF